MYLVRVPLAVACFLVAFVLTFIPGPAFVFWIVGLMLLGFGVGQILMSIHRVQDVIRRYVPGSTWLPRFRTAHMKAILRHRWVRRLDGMSSHREHRRRARERRRAARTGAPRDRRSDHPADGAHHA